MATLNDPPGQIVFGGTPTPITGTSAAIASLVFLVLPAAAGAVVQFTGTVNTLATSGGVAIGLATPRKFIAGNVSLLVKTSRRKQVDDATASSGALGGATGTPRERRGTACGSPPCSTCASPRETGDTNGDCIFDINDVTAHQAFMLGYVFNTSVIYNYLPAQVMALDADKNGVYSNLDSLFLLRVNFRL